MKNIFDPAVVDEFKNRIDSLNKKSKALWGKMNVAQMLAHCNISYELVYDNKLPKASTFHRFMMKLFVKKTVVGEKAYRKNSPTAPHFKIDSTKDFEYEKDRLILYIEKTAELGPEYFDGKESHSFGPLTRNEWNNYFYNHLDHHLRQFGV
ncbi:MAG: DUF1569 domain-containing protein [Bacteroidetes bacterium]|nr:MAG: DUF1569 domain-containing protein [Bacteroidota bacterium]